MTATPTPLRERLLDLADRIGRAGINGFGNELRDLAEEATPPASGEAGADLDAEVQAYRQFHLNADLALLGADALTIDREGSYDAAIENTLNAIRRLAAVAPAGMVLTGHVSGYLPRQQAIEIKADAPLPAWLTSQQFLRVTLAAAPSPASRARPETQWESWADFVVRGRELAALTHQEPAR